MGKIGFLLSPIPDFLEDHTLLGGEAPERIREHCARWVQFVSSLWKWRDEAAFCLRFRGEAGQIHAAFLAAPREPSLAAELGRDLEVLLRSYRLLAEPERSRLPDVSVAKLSHLRKPHLIRVAQHLNRETWRQEMAGDGVSADKNSGSGQRAETAVVYGWWGPGGPFLLPMESLVSQRAATTLSIYLEPTRLTPSESEWLRAQTRESASQSEQSEALFEQRTPLRKADPVALLASRLYLANFRRLMVNPFLVAVHCAADNGDQMSARNIAGTFQAIVNELPFELAEAEEERLPSGSDVNEFNGSENDSRIQRQQAEEQYDSLYFQVRPRLKEIGQPNRLPYLADAKGAATVFRLPVSVRGGVPGMVVRQMPPLFEAGSRRSAQPEEGIIVGHFETGGDAVLPLKALTKHALITGFTGSGKTNTVLNFLHQIWIVHGVPFLVIESAKHEYRGLLATARWLEKERARRQPGRGPMLRVYTLGNETCAPFRFNPFQLLKGVRLEAHLGRLLTCFQAAVSNIGPLPSILMETLVNVYRDKGWTPTMEGPDRPEGSPLAFPTMTDLYEAVAPIVEERYSGEVQNNIRGAVEGRIKPFTRLIPGSRSWMMDVPVSNPSAEELFEHPAILELNDLNEEDKSLVVMFVLTLLREYREQHHGEDEQRRGKGLLHVTVVEEAHNVLEKAESVGGSEGGAADTKYKAVMAFCNMLAEVRAYGEGLFIADQSPNRLATDAMRNTNLQIAHQLRDAHDRDAVATAMLMSDEQKDFIGRLEPGHAAVFYTGLQKATFVGVKEFYPDPDGLPDVMTKWFAEKGYVARSVTAEQLKEFEADMMAKYPGYGFNPKLPDERVRAHMAGLVARMPDLPYAEVECAACQSQCLYRQTVLDVLPKGDAAGEELRRRFRLFDGGGLGVEVGKASSARFCSHVADFARRTLAGTELVEKEDGVWCYLSHFWRLSRSRPLAVLKTPPQRSGTGSAKAKPVYDAQTVRSAILEQLGKGTR